MKLPLLLLLLLLHLCTLLARFRGPVSLQQMQQLLQQLLHQAQQHKQQLLQKGQHAATDQDVTAGSP